MERLLLVDGHNLLFRMFYGMPDQYRTVSGKKFNAVYGFGRVLSNVCAETDPSRMLVAFDSPDCGERRSLDADYKANRPDFSDASPDDCPFTQLPAIYALLTEMRIPHAEIHGCEADDVIASYARRCSEDGEVMIFSTDRDYWQLISERVSILDYRPSGSSLVTPEEARKKFGVEPEQLADLKCLVGDKSDNIVGVPGVGPKTAAALLNRFGSVEGILGHLDEVERPAVRRALEESRERLALNARLILLSGGAPLPYEPETIGFRFLPTRNLLRLSEELADLYD